MSRISGTGMNALELEANKQLTEVVPGDKSGFAADLSLLATVSQHAAQSREEDRKRHEAVLSAQEVRPAAVAVGVRGGGWE